jgi:hypothetical protein
LISTVVVEAFVPSEIRGFLLDAVRVMLDCSSPEEFKEYFEQRGIPWSIPSYVEFEGESTEVEPDVEQLVEDQLTGGITKLFEGETNGTPIVSVTETALSGNEIVTASPPQPATNPEPTPLPPIGEVSLEELPSNPSWAPSVITGISWGGGGGSSRPIDPQRTTLIGYRGEELIYKYEIKRVTDLGFPSNRVVWVSQEDPNADHDILSVDDDGTDLFIEVKSTTGTDGHFTWPRSEFKLAVKKRKGYVLYRVYLTDSTQVKYKPFRDPVGMLVQERLRLNIDTLSAQVEPL